MTEKEWYEKHVTDLLLSPIDALVHKVWVAAQSNMPESLHTFVNAAAGEGFVLDGVDAGDLYVELFPERYTAAIKGICDE
jgi:hypothetical protein